eukprot:4373354-Pleurochrysis_carterae.AAC.2
MLWVQRPTRESKRVRAATSEAWKAEVSARASARLCHPPSPAVSTAKKMESTLARAVGKEETPKRDGETANRTK